MSDKYYQCVGRRKTAVAQVRIFPGGTGKVTVNGKEMKVYFPVKRLQEVVTGPLSATGRTENTDVTVRAVGGGPVGQADAVRLGIARALVKMDESMKETIKGKGMLTRDPRKKERKKFGKRGARRSKQWRKR